MGARGGRFIYSQSYGPEASINGSICLEIVIETAGLARIGQSVTPRRVLGAPARVKMPACVCQAHKQPGALDVCGGQGPTAPRRD